MQVPAGPKGTRDFYPEDMAVQDHIFSSWKKTCERYGFEPYEGPMFEHLELFKQKSGNEIEDQLYFFKDKKGRDLALRPEMTPSLARMVAARGRDAKLPIRWYSIPRLFRYEKMQRGRLREFFQLNMDILGVAGVSADAELIAAVIDMMRDLGLTANDFKVRISSRTLLEELFLAAGLAPEQCPPLYALLDKKSKIPPEEFSRELAVIAPDAVVRDKIEAVFKTGSFEEVVGIGTGLPSVNDLKNLFDLLAVYGCAEFVTFDIGIVRGLAYYTGIVFEVFDSQKTLRAIAGGGRYDKLVSLYGGPSTPAVGFAAGDVVLAELLREKGLLPPARPGTTCFCIAVNEPDCAGVITLARELRDAGVSSKFPLKYTAVGKQLKQANEARSVFALFVGGSEGAEGMIKVKNMATGEEQLVPRDQVVETMAAFVRNGTGQARE